MTQQQHPARSNRFASFFDALCAPRSRSRLVDRDRRQLTAIVAFLAAVPGLATFLMSPKAAVAQPVTLVNVDVAVVGKGYRASRLIGSNVVNDKNESIGKLDEIIIDKNNNLYAVLQVGGFLGLGSRLVAVPFNNLKIADDGKKIELPGASKDELNKLTEFKYLA